MNVLQILPRLDIGGVETGTVDLAKYLKDHGHTCVVVSAGGELVAELEAQGIRHYALPVHHKAFWVMFKAARKVAEIIRRENIEIVHARSRVPAWIGFMAARQTRAVLVTTAHGHYSRHIFSYLMGFGKFTIVPSAVIGKHMKEDFGVPLENIRLIPRSVDLDKYLFRGARPRKTDFVVGVVGRIAPIKGQIYFLKSLARLLRSAPYVKGLIVGGVSPGKDNYMEELEVWVRRLGLSHCVEFLGNRRDVPAILAQLDCLVMPSITEESFGRVIVEAQAIGVPVVASRVGGVVEIIDEGLNGLLVPPKDDEALAEAILRILKDTAFAQKLIQNGRRKVEERFSLTTMAQETLKVYRQALEAPRILVIKISAIGDAVLAVPALGALKKKFPLSRIVCLTGEGTGEVFQRCPYIDELIVYDAKGKDRGLKGFWSFAKKLMHRRFDCVIDLQNNRKSHLFCFATFSSRRYGYDNGKFSFLLNHRIRGAKDRIPPVQHQFRVLKMLDIPYEGQRLELWPSEEDTAFAQNFLKGSRTPGQKLIGINIGSSRRWESKRWLADRFAKLCDELARRGYRVCVTGNASDASFARRILYATKSAPLCAVARTTLLQLASLVRACDVYVTSDSAPLHIAAAMRTPFVALFGPTDAQRHLPPATHCVILQKDCLPCYSQTCVKKHHHCMKKITVEEVVKAVEELLQEPKEIL